MKKQLIILLLLVSFTSLVFSQSKDKKLQKAIELCKQEKYFKSQELLNKTTAKNKPDNQEINLLIYNAHKLRRYDDLEFWAGVNIREGAAHSSDYYLFWNILARNNKIELASQFFDSYQERRNTEPDIYIDDPIENYKLIRDSLMNINEGKFEVENAFFNTSGDEVSPRDSHGKIYFQQTENINGKFEIKYFSFENLYLNKKSKINTVKNAEFGDFGFCFTEHPRRIFFTEKLKYDKESKQISRKIQQGTFLENNINTTKGTSFNSADYKCKQPFISEDGKYLFFISDMKGGFGGDDLYVSLWDNDRNNWGIPNNLGPEINSEWDESSPYFKNGVLYFSSYGKGGLGGMDIFKTSWDGIHSFEKIHNLGYPFNSPADDIGIHFIDDKTALISSDREGGKGRFDIYFIKAIEQED